ncbi:MAG: hypothetical protein P1U68_17640 [Verrucomicrobiales bacterium]|nr:hypothetical protein [Verrucomicrobiales bacterium]
MWRKIQKTLATVIPALLMVVFLIVMVCYLNRWDSMTAITLIPVWAWAAVGMLSCILSWLAFRGMPAVIVFCTWLIVGIAFSEESHGIFRELVQAINRRSPPEEERQLRVINLNAGRNPEAVKRVLDLEPDIVFIQDSPEEKLITEMTNEAFGVERIIFVGSNQAILASGELLNSLSESNGTAIHARIRIPSGFIVDLTSLDLPPCFPSPYLWRPETWKDLTQRRIQNRRLLRNNLGENQITRASTGRIVSGGFNTPAGDDVFRPLESNGLSDAFKSSGTGWGNTYPANCAALRFDQIWASQNLEPYQTFTRLNSVSKHRIVVSDFILPEIAE